MSLKRWETALTEHGWRITDKLPDGTPCCQHLPCGEVTWIDGDDHGVHRTGYIEIRNGTIMLHGSPASEDCSVEEFIRRLTAEPVVEVVRPKQRGLWDDD